MPSPLPLQVHPNSGLLFPWAFTGSFNLHLTDQGVGWAETMMIYWEDLEDAIVALLGYSWRDTSTVATLGFPTLRRKLPWQHPYFNQLWVQGISEVRGLRMQGTNQTSPPEDGGHDFQTPGGGAGVGTPLNFGPWTNYERALLVIQFHRPPYFVRSDADIVDPNTGYQQEWLRYVDKHWSLSTQVLTSGVGRFLWAGSPSNSGTAGYANGLPGSVGQVVQHQRLSRTWYQIPEAALFNTAQDATPNGQAVGVVYQSTSVYNPITGYYHQGGLINPIANCVNSPIGGGLIQLEGTTTAGSAVVTMASTAGLHGMGGGYDGDMVFGTGIRTGTSVVSVVANTSVTLSVAATASGTVTLGFISDYDVANRLFGCRMGTLRYDGVELIPRPLQLPPYLMQIPIFAGNEAISQQQYDVRVMFDIFDPPRAQMTSGSYPGGAARGHNLMPFSGNGMWYPVNSQQGADGTLNPPFLTPHPYADLTDIFQIN